MEKKILDKIDKACLPTISKYVKEQLIGAIFKYLEKGVVTSFTDIDNARENVKEIGKENFYQAILENIVKVDALHGIEAVHLVIDFGKDYKKHSVGETELRLFETLSLSVEDVFNTTAISDAIKILKKDGVALYNAITSFVEFRYVRGEMQKLDVAYLSSDLHKRIIWKIEEYFKTIN